MIINSKDLKLILLTGTPIANNPFELAICFNMLAGKPNKPLMPEDYIDFYNYFIDEENRTIKNKEKFQNRLFGLVSYISYDFVKTEEIELPKELNTIIRYLPMQPDQYMLYQLARDKELEEKQKFPSYPLKPVPSLQKPRNAHASSYRVRSRQASNFAISNINNINKIIDPLDLPFVASPQIVDEQITSNKLIDLYQNLSNSSGLNLVYSQFVGIGGLGAIQRYLEIRGWKQFIIKKSKKDKLKLLVEVKDDDEGTAEVPSALSTTIINGGSAEYYGLVRIAEKNDFKSIKKFIKKYLSNLSIDYLSPPFISAIGFDKDNNIVAFATYKLADSPDNSLREIINIDRYANKLINYKKLLKKTIKENKRLGRTGGGRSPVRNILSSEPTDFILNQTIFEGYGNPDTSYLDNIISKIGGSHRGHAILRNKGGVHLTPIREKMKKEQIIIPEPIRPQTEKLYNVVSFDIQIRKTDRDDVKELIKQGHGNIVPENANEWPYISYVAEHVMDAGKREIMGIFILKHVNSNNYLELVDIVTYAQYVRFGVGTLLFHKITDILDNSTVNGLRMYIEKSDPRKKETLEFVKKMGMHIIEDNPTQFILELVKDNGVPTQLFGGGCMYPQRRRDWELARESSDITESHGISESHVFTNLGIKYSIKKLIDETKKNEIKILNPKFWIKYLDDFTWWENGKQISPNMVLDNRICFTNNFERIKNSDLNFPIILTPDKQHIIDGVHRLAKCYLVNCDRMKFIVATETQMENVRIHPKFSRKKTGGDEVKRFAVISANVHPEDRREIQEMFNSEKNKYGDIINTLLISSTGAEGLDLKNIRNVHILEPYWNYGRISQIIARAVRINSHKSLKPDERTVQPYIYVSIKPESKNEIPTNNLNDLDPLSLTTDMELLKESMQNQTILSSFLKAIQEISIECLTTDNKNCRVCNPTNIPLFIENIDSDMISDNPCKTYTEEKIIANEIIINDHSYYYKENPNSIFGYTIFEFDEGINGYRSMPEDSGLFKQIIEKIELESNKSSTK